MRAPNIVRFSHLNPSYSESLKTLHLYIKSEDERMDKKHLKKGVKTLLMNRLNAKAVATF
ncbi:hypothetical protein BHOIPH601_08280 [Bartonella henselae]